VSELNNANVKMVADALAVGNTANSAANNALAVGNTANSAANNALAGGHYGQAWQAPARAIGTTYTNSTGKPIQVKVVMTVGSNDYGLYIGAVLVDRSSAYGGAHMYPQLSGIVPSGATYRVVLLSGSGTLLYWRELR